MKTTHDASQRDHSIPEPLRQDAIALRGKYGWLYDKTLTILREADIVGNYLLTRFEYEVETQLITTGLPKAHSPEDVRQIIWDAFGHWFLVARAPGGQEHLRSQWAAYNLWEVWQDWQEEQER